MVTMTNVGASVTQELQENSTVYVVSAPVPAYHRVGMSYHSLFIILVVYFNYIGSDYMAVTNWSPHT